MLYGISTIVDYSISYHTKPIFPIFFTSILTGKFSQNSDWLKDSLGLQVTSKYSK